MREYLRRVACVLVLLAGCEDEGAGAEGCPLGTRDHDSDPSTACVVDEWIRQFGTIRSDSANAVAVASDGSILVGGRTSGDFVGSGNFGGIDAFVRKYDAGGAPLWTRQFGTAEYESVDALSVGDDGSFVVSGSTSGPLTGPRASTIGDAYVRVYDPEGVEVWTRVSGADNFASATTVSLGSDGSVYVAGVAHERFDGTEGLGGWDVYVRKYAPHGEEAWTRYFGSDDHDYMGSVGVATDGSVYVAGSTFGQVGSEGSMGSLDGYLCKYDASGVLQWARQIGTPFSDSVNAMSVGSDGGVYVAGTTGGELGATENPDNSTDSYVRKYDSEGEEVWTTQLDQLTDDFAITVSAAGDGSVYVAGDARGDAGGVDAELTVDSFLVRLDRSGAEVWRREFGTAETDRLTSSGTAGDGSVVVVGYTAGDLVEGDGHPVGGDAFVARFGDL